MLGNIFLHKPWAASSQVGFKMMRPSQPTVQTQDPAGVGGGGRERGGKRTGSGAPPVRLLAGSLPCLRHPNERLGKAFHVLTRGDDPVPGVRPCTTGPGTCLGSLQVHAHTYLTNLLRTYLTIYRSLWKCICIKQMSRETASAFPSHPQPPIPPSLRSFLSSFSYSATLCLHIYASAVELHMLSVSVSPPASQDLSVSCRPPPRVLCHGCDLRCVSMSLVLCVCVCVCATSAVR